MTTTRQETIHRDVHAAAQAALTLAPTADLLTAAYALTHRIHEATSTPEQRNAGRREGLRIREHRMTDDLRAQRDLITAEITRRAGA